VVVTKLAQTSISFRRFDVDEQDFQQFSTQIDDLAARVAIGIYGPSVELDVVLEVGSLLVRITVIGVIGHLLLGGYDAISKYSEFKKGIIELAKDAQEYGSAIYDQVRKLTGEQEADYVAKRHMTPGRIARVIQKLEELQKLEKMVPPQVMQEKLQAIARDVKAIERDLEPEEIKLVNKAFELGGLPPPEKLPMPGPKKGQPIAILREKEIAEIRHPVSQQKGRKRLRHHNRFAVTGRKPV
jgi:hypothetical protein